MISQAEIFFVVDPISSFKFSDKALQSDISKVIIIVSYIHSDTYQNVLELCLPIGVVVEAFMVVVIVVLVVIVVVVLVTIGAVVGVVVVVVNVVVSVVVGVVVGVVAIVVVVDVIISGWNNGIFVQYGL